MTNYFSTRGVVLVGFLSITLPVASRLVASPLVLLLLSPFIFLVFVLGSLGFVIFLNHHLDSRKQHRAEHVYRAVCPFAFSTPAAWQAVLTRSQWSQTQSHPPLYPQSPSISVALNDLLNQVVRDFVWSWYSDISSSPSFPIAVSSLFHASLAQLLLRASRIDFAAFVVRRILPKVTSHIDQFRQSEIALRGTGLERKLTQSEELDLLLASRYAGKGTSKLHPAIDNLSTTFTKQNEEMHLRQLMDRAMPFLLPETDARSTILKITVREIVACTVLYPLLDMITDPDFWNQIIDQVVCILKNLSHSFGVHFCRILGWCCNSSAVSLVLLRRLNLSLMPSTPRKLVSRVRNIIEVQYPRSTVNSHIHEAPPTSENITIRTDIHKFDSFLRSINRYSSLLDARRLKNDILGEIRRTRMLLGMVPVRRLHTYDDVAS